MPGANAVEAVAPVLNRDPPCARRSCRGGGGDGSSAATDPARADSGGRQRRCAEELDGGADNRLDHICRRAQPRALGEKAEEVGK